MSSASVQSQSQSVAQIVVQTETESAAQEGIALRSGEGGESERRERRNGRGGGAGGEAAAAGELPHRGTSPRPEPRAGRSSRRRRHHDPTLRRGLRTRQSPPPPRRQGFFPHPPLLLPRILVCSGLNPRYRFAGPRGGASRRSRIRVRLRGVRWGGAIARFQCRGFQVYPNLAHPMGHGVA